MKSPVTPPTLPGSAEVTGWLIIRNYLYFKIEWLMCDGVLAHQSKTRDEECSKSKRAAHHATLFDIAHCPPLGPGLGVLEGSGLGLSPPDRSLGPLESPGLTVSDLGVIPAPNP
jgi:hypothetical protein